jgi:hypothetical protein
MLRACAACMTSRSQYGESTRSAAVRNLAVLVPYHEDFAEDCCDEPLLIQALARETPKRDASDGATSCACACVCVVILCAALRAVVSIALNVHCSLAVRLLARKSVTDTEEVCDVRTCSRTWTRAYCPSAHATANSAIAYYSSMRCTICSATCSSGARCVCVCVCVASACKTDLVCMHAGV